METQRNVEVEVSAREATNKELENTLNYGDTEYDEPVLPKEAGAFEDNTGYYEVPFCPCLSYEFWNRWLRVDTHEVLMRLGKSLLFFKTSLIDDIKNVPDLYGPFWIYATLSFMLGISGNLDAYIMSDDKVNEYHGVEEEPVHIRLLTYRTCILLRDVRRVSDTNIYKYYDESRW